MKYRYFTEAFFGYSGTVRGIYYDSYAVVAFPLSFVAIIAAFVVFPSCAQAFGSSASGSFDLGQWELGASIPGTAEYNVQQQAHTIETCLGGIDDIATCSVTLQLDEERYSAIVMIALNDLSEWSSELERMTVALVTHCVPDISGESILIADRQGHILYDNGISCIPPVLPPQSVSHTQSTSFGGFAGIWTMIAVVVIIAGVILILGWRIYVASLPGSTHQEQPTPKPWAFLCEYDRGLVCDFMKEQRQEVVGAILSLLDPSTRKWMRPVLRELRQQPICPTRDIGVEIENSLIQEVRQALTDGLVESEDRRRYIGSRSEEL